MGRGRVLRPQPRDGSGLPSPGRDWTALFGGIPRQRDSPAARPARRGRIRSRTPARRWTLSAALFILVLPCAIRDEGSNPAVSTKSSAPHEDVVTAAAEEPDPTPTYDEIDADSFTIKLRTTKRQCFGATGPADEATRAPTKTNKAGKTGKAGKSQGKPSAEAKPWNRPSSAKGRNLVGCGLCGS
jgi:hypothetical protein